MGDNIEQWRARIGQWSGGRPRQCVILQHCIAQTSNHACYRLIRFLVLVSLLIIGCVELNPGPNQVRFLIHSNKCFFAFEIYLRRSFIKMKEEQHVNYNFQTITKITRFE